jgi:hypothetical protein
MLSENFTSLFDSIQSFDGDLETFRASYREKVGATVSEGRALIPDFLVISPPKTGTTWLAKHLTEHPQVFIPPEKEVRYFDVLWRFHEVNWYLNKFSPGSDHVKGEVSPQYAWLPEAAIQQIHDLNPNLKLIFIARRLPQRAWSHTRHCFRHREGAFRNCTGSFISLSHDEIMRDFLSDLSLTSSDYLGTIHRWMRFFPRTQFHVRYFEDVIAQPTDYLRDVYRFLNVDTEINCGRDLHEAINAGITARMPDWAEQIIADIYASRQLEVVSLLSDIFGLASPWSPLLRPSDPPVVRVLDGPGG